MEFVNGLRQKRSALHCTACAPERNDLARPFLVFKLTITCHYATTDTTATTYTEFNHFHNPVAKLTRRIQSTYLTHVARLFATLNSQQKKGSLVRRTPPRNQVRERKEGCGLNIILNVSLPHIVHILRHHALFLAFEGSSVCPPPSLCVLCWNGCGMGLRCCCREGGEGYS